MPTATRMRSPAPESASPSTGATMGSTSGLTTNPSTADPISYAVQMAPLSGSATTDASTDASSASASDESDCRVIHVAQSERAVIGQIASHRDVARRLVQRQAETFLPGHYVDLVGQRARLVRVHLGQRLIDLGVDGGIADLAE